MGGLIIFDWRGFLSEQPWHGCIYCQRIFMARYIELHCAYARSVY